MSDLDYEKARSETQRYSIDLALRLFELRRDETLRRARTYLLFELEPTVKAFQEACKNTTSETGLKVRQGISFWDQIAGILLHGLGGYDSPTVFGANQEMFILYAKLEPILPELEQVFGHKVLANISELARCSDEAKGCMDRARQFIARMNAK